MLDAPSTSMPDLQRTQTVSQLSKYDRKSRTAANYGQLLEKPDQEHDHEEDDQEEEVDEVVLEDMKKLEDNFPGISDRFRLVNRIGEGIVCNAPSFTIRHARNTWIA
jgi:cell division control protein 7